MLLLHIVVHTQWIPPKLALACQETSRIPHYVRALVKNRQINCFTPSFLLILTFFFFLLLIPREIGKELAKRPNLAVVTGGFFGAPDVVARMFHECRVNNGHTDPRVFHILPKRDDKVEYWLVEVYFHKTNFSSSFSDFHWESTAKQWWFFRCSELWAKLVPWEFS